MFSQQLAKFQNETKIKTSLRARGPPGVSGALRSMRILRIGRICSGYFHILVVESLTWSLKVTVIKPSETFNWLNVNVNPPVFTINTVQCCHWDCGSVNVYIGWWMVHLFVCIRLFQIQPHDKHTRSSHSSEVQTGNILTVWRHWITWHFNNRYKEHIVQPHFSGLGRKKNTKYKCIGKAS